MLTTTRFLLAQSYPSTYLHSNLEVVFVLHAKAITVCAPDIVVNPYCPFVFHRFLMSDIRISLLRNGKYFFRMYFNQKTNSQVNLEERHSTKSLLEINLTPCPGFRVRVDITYPCLQGSLRRQMPHGRY